MNKPKIDRRLILCACLVATSSVGLIITHETTLGKPVSLAVADAGAVTPQEVSRGLISMWLEHSRATLDVRRRLNAFEIESVGEPLVRGDSFLIGAAFSVRPTFMEVSDWIAGNGVPSGDGWIRHKYLFFNITEANGDYTMQVAGTGP